MTTLITANDPLLAHQILVADARSGEVSLWDRTMTQKIRVMLRMHFVWVN